MSDTNIQDLEMSEGGGGDVSASLSDANPNHNVIANKDALAESVHVLNDLVDNSTANLETTETTTHLEQNLNNYRKAFNTIFELSEDELNRIEEHVRNKILHNGENFLQQHENLRVNYEKFKIEYEQRFIELEADFNESQNKLGIELKNSHVYRTKATENGYFIYTFLFIFCHFDGFRKNISEPKL